MTEQYWENLIDEIDTLKRADAIARLKKIASDQRESCALTVFKMYDPDSHGLIDWELAFIKVGNAEIELK